MSARLFARLAPEHIKENPRAIFQTASGESIDCYGCFTIPFILQGRRVEFDFYVTTNLEEDCIVGLDFLDKNFEVDTNNMKLRFSFKGYPMVVDLVTRPPGCFNISTKQEEGFKLDHLTKVQQMEVKKI